MTIYTLVFLLSTSTGTEVRQDETVRYKNETECNTVAKTTEKSIEKYFDVKVKCLKVAGK
jgi:hypothetical protein